MYSHHDASDLAEGARPDQVPGFFHHRVAGVVVGESEQQAGLGDLRRKRAGFGEVKRGRLVRHDMKTGRQRGPRDREVQMVRHRDGDEVHALVLAERGFGAEHLVETAVAARRGEPVQVGAGALRPIGVARERTADQFDRPVEFRRHAVDGADEGPVAAADEAHAESLHETSPGRPDASGPGDKAKHWQRVWVNWGLAPGLGEPED